MAKNVFRPMEIMNLVQKVEIQAPVFESIEEVEELDELTEMEEYTGPTADDLRREAEEFKQRWEQEKSFLVSQAENEANQIKERAQESSAKMAQDKVDDAQIESNKLIDEATLTLNRAKDEAEKIINEAKAETEKIKAEAYNEGVNLGKEEGYNSGRDEVQRLVDRVHKVLNAAIDKRRDIIMEAENQMVELVLLISQKVVKVISEEQKNVVLSNVIQALRKMKSRGEVEIKVNLADVALTTEHIKDFMEMIESVSAITVLEDSTIEKGGCIIETNLGRIDARISSQLREIEDRIRDLMPIKADMEKKRLEEFGDL
ncbi:flagellar assembly protein FliH [Thiospirochaeta perfilievii]|uniref:Flagellar assembly protein FliH n=1 Tax=Thiospirochaeta perfilievii TaxID=252967 RepID=A0A5C1QBZ5_9SPIO|nr:flagellar assembly protein FliH [Thiospirochaeta perfilievii]QEN03732.1 flagellar assembly protein FliH [Thiospirochaeta perfilievii]